MRPVIGVWTQQRRLVGAFGELPAHTLGRRHTDGLERAGGLPVLLGPQHAEHLGALRGRWTGSC
jgi:hypothetical protein